MDHDVEDINEVQIVENILQDIGVVGVDLINARGYRYMREHYAEVFPETVQGMVEKHKPKQEPSPSLKYSFQVVVRKEMPVGEPEENPNGNLAEYLSSIFNTAEHYATGSKSASDIEVIVNLNHSDNDDRQQSDGYSPAIESNNRAVQLIDFITSSQELEDGWDAVKYFPWLESSSTEVRSFYKNLIERGRRLTSGGLQIHAIQTGTDYIRYDDMNDTSNGGKPGQGNRRLLATAVAENRFATSNVPPENQVQFFADSDIRYSRNFLKEVDSRFENVVVPFALFTQTRFVADKSSKRNHADYDFSETTDEIVRSEFTVYELRDVIKSLKHNGQVHNYMPFLETAIANVALYQETEGWDKSKPTHEDTDIVSKFSQSAVVREYMPETLTT